MMKTGHLLIILFILSIKTYSFDVNQAFWVFFTDKDGVTFDPYTYFDAKAIERRIENGISLYDVTDYPLQENYIKTVSALADSITGQSRWLNGIYVHGNQTQIDRIKNLSFVESVFIQTQVEFQLSSNINKRHKAKTESSFELNEIEIALLEDQVERMGGSKFHEKGINGKGIRIAILDAGFPSVDIHPAFEHIRNNNRIIDTYDFVKKKKFVYKYSSHGTTVLSCIAGKYGEKAIGLAPEAEFLLARTEKSNSEPFSEEKNWLAAMEWADKNGASIINSSLAYTYHRYFTTEMDGKTSLVSKAARIAARKGILVVNAAGNDGDKDWKIIATPADVDSVLTIGGINPYTDYHMNFSSFGPSSDKKMKPNVCAYAQVIAAAKEGMTETYGTSFASPLVAGFAACVWQYKKKINNMEVFDLIQKSAHLYPYYDYAHGFGVPQADKILGIAEEAEQAFEVIRDKFVVKVLVDEYFGDSSLINDVIIEDQVLEDDSFTTDSIGINPDIHFQMQMEAFINRFSENEEDILYYHIENKNGFVTYYSVIEIYQREALVLDRDIFGSGSKLRVHYKGFTKTIEF